MEKSYLTWDRILFLVSNLKSMIDAPEEHFNGYKMIEHGPNCPDESTDFFASPDIKKHADSTTSSAKPDFKSDDDSVFNMDQVDSSEKLDA